MAGGAEDVVEEATELEEDRTAVGLAPVSLGPVSEGLVPGPAAQPPASTAAASRPARPATGRTADALTGRRGRTADLVTDPPLPVARRLLIMNRLGTG